MSNAVFLNSYKLKKGASVPDFLLAVDKLLEHTSKLEGFISFKLLRDGDTWTDYAIFETMDDAKNFAETGAPKDLAEKFYSFLNFNTCKSHFFSVERSY